MPGRGYWRRHITSPASEQEVSGFGIQNGSRLIDPPVLDVSNLTTPYGSPALTGQIDAAAPTSAPAFQWTSGYKTNQLSPPTIYNGSLIVQANGGQLAAVDTEQEGALAFDHTLAGSFSSLGPVMDQDRAEAFSVFNDGGGYRVVCLDVTDGSFKWQSSTTGYDAVLGGGGVLLSRKVDTNQIVAFNQFTGEQMWSVQMQDTPTALNAIDVDGRRAFVGDSIWSTDAADAVLRCVDLDDGTDLWTTSAAVLHAAGGDRLSPRTIYDADAGLVYCHETDNRTLRAVDASTGTLQWSVSGVADEEPAVLPGGGVVVGTVSSYGANWGTTAFDSTGTELWSYGGYTPARSVRMSSVSDVVFITTSSEVTHAIDATTGAGLYTTPNKRVPVIANGYLLAKTAGSNQWDALV